MMTPLRTRAAHAGLAARMVAPMATLMATLAAAAGIASTGPARAQSTANAPPAAEVAMPTSAGFAVEVQGLPADRDVSAFVTAVQAALPEALVDPAQNFTRDPAYDPAAPYRLVLVFHGTTELATEQVCTSTLERQPLAPPPDFDALTGTTHLTAAFCNGSDPLSTASDRLLGEVQPGQASFRFLVEDIAKQLFPGGFALLPGVGPETRAVPPG